MNVLTFRVLALLLFIIGSVAYSQQVVDRIVAVVDDDIILQSELTQHAINFAIQLKIDPRKEPEKFNELMKNTLDNLIIQKMLLVKAEEETVKVEDRQVDAVLDERIEMMIQQLGSSEKVEEYFGAPIKKIKRDFRDEVKQSLMVETLQAQKFRQIFISRREVEEFYQTMRDSLPQQKESVHISHILLKVRPGQEARKRAAEKIQKIIDRIKAGEDFAELAKQYSEDPGSAAKGGELGFIQRGDFVREFEEVAFALKPGELSDIVETQFGLHVIQLIERRGEKINARHILIALQATPDDEKATIERIKELRHQIVTEGADFADMAKKYSDDESTREKGGDLGWFEVEQLQIKEFKWAINGLKPGEVSDPVKTKFGLHIIKLLERQEARSLSLEQDWDKIEAWALNLKRQKEFQKWIEQLRKEIYVEIKEQ